MSRRSKALLAALTLTAAAAPAVVHAQLYAGGDGIPSSYASWINNPANTLNQIVFDDFVIGSGQSWTITSLFGTMSNSVTPPATSLLWEIRTGMAVGSSTGTVVASGGGAFSQVGNVYTVGVSSLTLGAGTYWMSLYADLTGIDPLNDPNDPNSQPFFGVGQTNGMNAINAPSNGQAIWLVGADAMNVGGSANPISADFTYGVNGRSISAVPEPATWALFSGGLVLLGAVGRRRRSA